MRKLISWFRFDRHPMNSHVWVNLFFLVILGMLLLRPVSRLAPPQTTASEQWSVGYWTPWGNPALPPSQIEWAALTHVIYWGGLVQSDGSLDLTTQRVTIDGPTLIAAGHANGVKVLLGVTQAVWLGQTDTLEQATIKNLSILVNNIVDTVTSYGFDGVDIDWEPFSPGTNGQSMQELAAALRAELGDRLLTCAAIVNDYVFWGSVQSYFDRVQIMTYDLTGTWNPYAWHNAALYSPSDNAVWSVDRAVRRFTAAGIPAAKLSIGIPFYGWKWTGGRVMRPQQRWSSTPNLQQVYYQRLAPMITPQNYHWDSLAQVPYLSIHNGGDANGLFITYENEQSIAAKINYVNSKGLGGWIIWELSADYLPSETPNQPLLTAVRNNLGQ